jgi:very-short-patch-repair endonuclease
VRGLPDRVQPYGWTRSALRWAVDRGELVRLRPAVYREGDLGRLDPFERERWLHAAPAVAAVLSTPGALASHSTGAILHRLPLLFLPGLPCVTVVPWHTGEIRRAHVHRCTGEMFQLPVGAVETATVARTIIDLAREHGVAAGVVPADYALRRGLTNDDLLAATLHHCRRWPGVAAARAAIAAADPRSESPLESRSRLKLAAAGLGTDELQVRIADERRHFIGRVDFFWPEFGVVGEVDGSIKYADQGALSEEKWRQERLERTGLIVVRWGAEDLLAFGAVAQRLRRAFDRGSRRAVEDRRWLVLPSPAPAL